MKNIISRILFRSNYDDISLSKEIWIDLQVRKAVFISLFALTLVLTAFIVSLIF